MSLLWRSWLAFVLVIATALTALAFLSVLQHNAILSRLVQQRLAVIAQTTASSFRSIVDLGLPLSMMRNVKDVLQRAQQLDPAVTAIRVFNPSGIIINSTETKPAKNISRDVLRAFISSKADRWSIETETSLNAGFTIKGGRGSTVGAIVVVYPKQEFVAKTNAIASRITLATSLLLAVCSILAFFVLRLRLAGAILGLSKLERLFEKFSRVQKLEHGQDDDLANRPDYGFLGGEIERLEAQLNKADRQFVAARSKLAELGVNVADSIGPADIEGTPVLAGRAESPLARTLARHLTPWATILILGSALLLGCIVYLSVERSFQPELTARSKLIGAVANKSIQRAVSSGVPLEDLVGAEKYFSDLLKNFPEISYFGVATGRIILEAGTRQKSIFAPERSRKDVPTFPITTNGEQIGYIIIDANPEYFALQFRDVLLDFAVVVIVVILLAFQIMMVTISRSLTAPFVRLQHLAGFQAAGDFSKTTGVLGLGAVDRLSQLLSDRSVHLHQAFSAASSKLKVREKIAALNRIQKRFKFRRWHPDILRFSFLNDVRLPLLLVAAADGLPLSFFPIFARAADNPFTWLDQGVVISLPIAGYLLAIMLSSPLARPLAERFGHRRLLLFAVVPTVCAHVGLYLSSNIIEIIIFRTITGFGYAIATLACQDYVLEVVPREQRNRALGLFTAALFSGIFAGTAIGGVLADRLGQDTVFVISASLVLISGCLTLRLLPERPPAELEFSHRFRNYFPPIWQPLRSLRFTALVFGIAIPANVLLQAFIAYLVTLEMETLGASAADTARILMVYFLAVALVSPVAARFSDHRLQPTYITLIGAIITGLALCAPIFWPAQWSMLFAVGGAGLAHGMIRDTQVVIAMEIAEDGLAHINLNTVLGSLRMLERVGSIVGLICIALFSSFAGYSSAIGAVGVWVLGGAAAFAVAMYLTPSEAHAREHLPR